MNIADATVTLERFMRSEMCASWQHYTWNKELLDD
jgi:hypothetical protein